MLEKGDGARGSEDGPRSHIWCEMIQGLRQSVLAFDADGYTAQASDPDASGQTDFTSPTPAQINEKLLIPLLHVHGQAVQNMPRQIFPNRKIWLLVVDYSAWYHFWRTS